MGHKMSKILMQRLHKERDMGNVPFGIALTFRKAPSSITLIGILVLVAVSSTAPAQTFTPIHEFTCGEDGKTPEAGLTMDRAGNLYGTTIFGGTYQSGNVYKLTQRNGSWILTTLYDFKGGPDGYQPQSRVVFGPDGRLYGTTAQGGNSCGCGVAYALSPPPTACKTALCAWQETVLYSFANFDGIYPGLGDLTFDQAGNIYGTTERGGASYGGGQNLGYGAVYELTPANGGWSETVIHSFTDTPDGAFPYAGVTFDNAGNLYGTTFEGGSDSDGTIYRLAPSGSGWNIGILYNFDGSTGGFPFAGLISDQSGNFYGAASNGGPGGDGTVFELSPAGGGWQFSLLYGFSGNPSGDPAYNLLLAGGNLYSNLEGEIDHDFGAVVELTPSNNGWIQNVLHSFHLGSDGGVPVGNLIMDSSGNLYGASNLGGTYGCGLVFEITP